MKKPTLNFKTETAGRTVAGGPFLTSGNNGEKNNHRRLGPFLQTL
jgi:hypothetical protein